MRLTAQQLDVIRTAVVDYLGEGNGLWLFGSRVDDQRRGGDVDLYIETSERKPMLQILRLKIYLQDKLDLGVDLAIKNPGDDRPIFNIAKATGMRL